MKNEKKIQKEAYIPAVMEITEFDCEDIISTSTPIIPFGLRWNDNAILVDEDDNEA